MLRPSSVQLARSTVPVRLALLATLLLLLASLLPAAAATPFGARTVLAGHTPTPASVNLVGDLESEATGGACGDWDPGCVSSAFTAQGNGVYLFQSASIPAGDWLYKVAMGAWTENYGANFLQDGPNIERNLAGPQAIRFYYDHKTHYIADSVGNTIYTVPGSFNSELGCGGDWAPDCLRTLMSDVDGDGVFTFVTTAIPVGSYELKVATNESWNNPNFGAGGGPRQRRVHRRPVGQHGHGLVRHGDQRSDGRRRGRRAGARQQRRVGRPPPRLARHAVPDARRRRRGGHARHDPVPDLPRRRHRR